LKHCAKKRNNVIACPEVRQDNKTGASELYLEHCTQKSREQLDFGCHGQKIHHYIQFKIYKTTLLLLTGYLTAH